MLEGFYVHVADTSLFECHKTVVSTQYRFGPCVISLMGRTFVYDYEYFGAMNRLVVTPLTERAHMVLAMSIGAFQHGTLTGPCGTGKSATIQDLAKVCYNLMIFYQATQFLWSMLLY